MNTINEVIWAGVGLHDASACKMTNYTLTTSVVFLPQNKCPHKDSYTKTTHTHIIWFSGVVRTHAVILFQTQWYDFNHYKYMPNLNPYSNAIPALILILTQN